MDDHLFIGFKVFLTFHYFRATYDTEEGASAVETFVLSNFLVFQHLKIWKIPDPLVDPIKWTVSEFIDR